MNKIYIIAISLLLIFSMAGAQEMPTVFNNSYAGKGNQFKKVIVVNDADIISVGGGNEAIITKSDASGKVYFNKQTTKNGMYCFNDVAVDMDNNIVIAGGGTIAIGNASLIKLTPDGKTIFEKILGSNTGGYFTKVVVDKVTNDYILIGTDGSHPSRGRITRFTAKGQLLYDKVLGRQNVFTDIIFDEDGNLIAAGGDIGTREGLARITKIDKSGEVVFDKEFGKAGGWFKRVLLLQDGYSVLAIGGGAYGTGNGCRITKLREDGQMVFDKQYSNGDGTFNALVVNDLGQIIACGEEYEKGRIVKLRADGTELYNKVFGGPLYDVATTRNGDIVSIGGTLSGRGLLVKLLNDGSVNYEKLTNYPMRAMLLSMDGEIYATSRSDYHILKYGPEGNEMFDKRIYPAAGVRVDSLSELTYLSVLSQTPRGEVIAAGGGRDDGGRLLKMTHGITINDIVVSEPLNGKLVATLTVSLTGFLGKDGAKNPVTVNYATKSSKVEYPGLASPDDFKDVDGLLSFVPSDYQVGSPITQTIEVPVNSDNLFEGNERFVVSLSNAENAYIMRDSGVVMVTDQPAFVKFTGGSKGREPIMPVSYNIGLFKSDNTPLINKTGQPVNVYYGFGTGSALPDIDFVSRTKDPIQILPNQSEGAAQVKVINDNYYESEESVILILGDIKSANESVAGYAGGATSLSATQYIIDQPAALRLIKLADRNKSTTYPASMFKVELTRASDGRKQINCAGGDIMARFAVDSSGSAILGKNFVFLDGEMVKITGGCENSETAIKVSTINNHVKEGDKSVVIKLVSVEKPFNAGDLGISDKKSESSAQAFIRDDN